MERHPRVRTAEWTAGGAGQRTAGWVARRTGQWIARGAGTDDRARGRTHLVLAGSSLWAVLWPLLRAAGRGTRGAGLWSFLRAARGAVFRTVLLGAGGAVLWAAGWAIKETPEHASSPFCKRGHQAFCHFWARHRTRDGGGYRAPQHARR